MDEKTPTTSSKRARTKRPQLRLVPKDGQEGDPGEGEAGEAATAETPAADTAAPADTAPADVDPQTAAWNARRDELMHDVQDLLDRFYQHRFPIDYLGEVVPTSQIQIVVWLIASGRLSQAEAEAKAMEFQREYLHAEFQTRCTQRTQREIEAATAGKRPASGPRAGGLALPGDPRYSATLASAVRPGKTHDG